MLPPAHETHMVMHVTLIDKSSQEKNVKVNGQGKR